MTITNKVSLKSVNGGNTPIADVPDGATVGAVTSAFDGTATVAATAAATGGTPTTFVITPTPTTSPATFTGSSPVTVTGLSDGTSYTFTAAGVNTTATGPAGAASGSTAIVTAGSFFSIATTAGTGSSGTISFTSIPSTYSHLQIRMVSRGTTDNVAYYRFNSDTGANYADHNLYGNGTSVSAFNDVSNNKMGHIRQSDDASYIGTSIIDILDYTNTNKYKVARLLSGNSLGAAGIILAGSGLWMNTAAITSITIFSSGGNFSTNSKFALYGVMA